MTIFHLSYKNIKAKPLSTALNLVLFATGILIISFLLLMKSQLENQLQKNIADIDLVVGAKGSPLQLILSSIYHVDYPTGNITLPDAEKIKHNPLVKKTIPLALGDNYHGFRIVGTNHDYSDLYKGKLKKGEIWENDFEVTIGSKVADEGGLKIGDQFAGVHGLMAEGGHEHAESKYTVSGIFNETGSVLDQLILTNIGSVWEIHSHHHHHHDEEEGEHSIDEHEEEEHEEHADTTKEITSLLVFFKNPMGAVTLPREINKNTNMQAASPVSEINRLYSLLGIGIKSINMIAYIIILIAGFSIFISLFNSMKERTYELALMRVMGGKKTTLFAVIILEGIFITVAGFLAGLVLSRLAMLILSGYADSNFHYNLGNLFNTKQDLLLFGISLVIGFLALLLPAIGAMRTDISKTLSE